MIDRLTAVGVNIDLVTAQLTNEGIGKFIGTCTATLEPIRRKCEQAPHETIGGGYNA